MMAKQKASSCAVPGERGFSSNTAGGMEDTGEAREELQERQKLSILPAV